MNSISLWGRREGWTEGFREGFVGVALKNRQVSNKAEKGGKASREEGMVKAQKCLPHRKQRLNSPSNHTSIKTSQT